MKKILLTKIPLNSGVNMPASIALDSEGGEIQFNNVDTRTLILVENSHTAASDITFKMGTGIQAVADYVQSVPAGTTMGFVLESGAFKNKGVVVVKGPTTLKISAVVLP